MALIARACGSILLGAGPWMLGLSAVAWGAVFMLEGLLGANVCGSALRLWTADAGDVGSYILAACLWSVMTIAMMAPSLGPPVDHVWRSGTRRHRLAALFGFLTGYTVVWVISGLALLAFCAFLANRMNSFDLALCAGGIVLAWQVSPYKHLISKEPQVPAPQPVGTAEPLQGRAAWQAASPSCGTCD